MITAINVLTLGLAILSYLIGYLIGSVTRRRTLDLSYSNGYLAAIEMVLNKVNGDIAKRKEEEVTHNE